MICFIKLQTQECTLDVMFNHDHRITEILVFTVKHESIFEATLPPFFVFFPPKSCAKPTSFQAFDQSSFKDSSQPDICFVFYKWSVVIRRLVMVSFY